MGEDGRLGREEFLEMGDWDGRDSTSDFTMGKIRGAR